MTKYVITYGLKDNMKSKVENYNHLIDAWEDAQALALKELEESGKVPYTKNNIYNSFSDIIQAQSMYVDMASEYIDFHAKELTDESIIYIVSQQSSAFSNDKFIHISLEEALIILKEESILALDTETEGLDPYTKTLLLLQLGNKDYQINFDISSYGGVIPMQLVDFLNNHKCLFVLQNAKFDLKFLFKQDVLIRSVYDTMLAEIILTNGLQYDGRDLKTLGEKYCNVVLDKSVRGEIIAKGLSDRVIEYASNDVKYLLEIREKQLEKIKEYNLQTALDLDNAFVIVLAYTEYCGIKLDFDKWTIKALKNIDTAEGYRKELTDFLFVDGKTKYFSGMVDMFTGTRECLINWDSPKQVTKLFEEYGINVTIKVKGEEKISIEAKNLEPQQKDFPILIPYLKYKAAQKEVSTYGLGWKKHINPITGRIHTTYQQIMNTGRLSSGNKRDGTPNMQNIPRDAETRACFIAEKGNLLVDADYSS